MPCQRERQRQQLKKIKNRQRRRQRQRRYARERSWRPLPLQRWSCVGLCSWRLLRRRGQRSVSCVSSDLALLPCDGSASQTLTAERDDAGGLHPICTAASISCILHTSGHICGPKASASAEKTLSRRRDSGYIQDGWVKKVSGQGKARGRTGDRVIVETATILVPAISQLGFVEQGVRSGERVVLLERIKLSNWTDWLYAGCVTRMAEGDPWRPALHIGLPTIPPSARHANRTRNNNIVQLMKLG